MLAFRARRSALEAAGGFKDTALLRRGMLPKVCANLILYVGWAAVVAAAARGLSCLYHAGSDVETADDFFFGGDGVRCHMPVRLILDRIEQPELKSELEGAMQRLVHAKHEKVKRLLEKEQDARLKMVKEQKP